MNKICQYFNDRSATENEQVIQELDTKKAATEKNR